MSTKRQLEARIARLERELAKFKRGDRLRREGEHWYELTDFLDPKQIQAIPTPLGRTFLMGMIEDIYVMEYPRGVPTDEVEKFMAFTRSKGIAPCLAVVEGVRFLKLRSVDDQELIAQLDAVEDPNAPSQVVGDGESGSRDRSVPPGDRPELQSDGLAGDQPG